MAFMVAFMVPEYTNEPFAVVTDERGETFSCPWSDFAPGDFMRKGDTKLDIEYVEGKWWARLQAPGYLDATEWFGPNATKEEAEADLATFYDVCAKCGADFSDGEISNDSRYCNDCNPLDDQETP